MSEYQRGPVWARDAAVSSPWDAAGAFSSRAGSGGMGPVSLSSRELLLTCAYRRISFPNMSVDDELEEASPLAGCVLAEAFDELLVAVRRRDALAEHDPAVEAASVRVEEALDALLGEAS